QLGTVPDFDDLRVLDQEICTQQKVKRPLASNHGSGLKLCKEWIDKLRTRSHLLMELICAVRPSSCSRKGENRRSGLVGHGHGGTMKKKTLLLGAVLLIVLASEGCATVRGMGEDIQSLGRAVKRAVSGG